MCLTLNVRHIFLKNSTCRIDERHVVQLIPRKKSCGSQSPACPSLRIMYFKCMLSESLARWNSQIRNFNIDGLHLVHSFQSNPNKYFESYLMTPENLYFFGYIYDSCYFSGNKPYDRNIGPVESLSGIKITILCHCVMQLLI